MSFRITYRTFFHLNILHGYFLDQGGRPFDTLNPSEKEAVLPTYRVKDFMSIRPSAETEKLLNGRKIIARQQGTGLSLAISSEWDGSDWKPFIPLEDTLKLTFHLSIVDSLFFNYTNLSLNNQGEKIYYFSNQIENHQANTLHLSQPIKTHSSGSTYFAGDLYVDNSSNPTRLFEAIQHVPAGPLNSADWREWPAPAFVNTFPSPYVKGDFVVFGNQLYQASANPTSGSDPALNTTEWDAIGDPLSLGFQFVQAQDQLPFKNTLIRDDVSAANTDEIEVRIYQADPDGTQVGSPIFTRPIEAPSGKKLGAIDINLAHLAPGLYFWEIFDVENTSLILTSNSGIFYLHKETTRPFGVVEVFLDPSQVSTDYRLLDGSGFLQNPAPSYVIQFKNRSTFWRYRLNKALTLNTPGPLVPCDPLPSACYETSYPRPLTLAYEPLEVVEGANESLAPGPLINQIIPEKSSLTPDSYDKIYSDIYLRNF